MSTSVFTGDDLQGHEEMIKNLQRRRRRGTFWQSLFYLATTIAILALITLLLNIFNSAFGFVLIQNEVEPQTLVAGGDLTQLSQGELIGILEERLSSGLIRRFNHDEPLAERSQRDLIDLVQHRVINPTIIESFTLQESLFQQEMVRAARKEAG